MTMTVPVVMRFPLKNPILENLFTDQNVFFRMIDWSLSPFAVFTFWLIALLSLATLIWRAVVLAQTESAV